MRTPKKDILTKILLLLKLLKVVLLAQFHITEPVWKSIGFIPFRYLPHITDGTFIVDT